MSAGKGHAADWALVCFPDAGHVIHLDQPRPYLDTIRSLPERRAASGTPVDHRPALPAERLISVPGASVRTTAQREEEGHGTEQNGYPPEEGSLGPRARGPSEQSGRRYAGKGVGCGVV